MNSPLLPAAAAALCAAVLLVLMRHFIRTPPPSPIQPQEKTVQTPPLAVSTPGSDVEKGETPPPTGSYFSDVKIRSELVEEVWPPVEQETADPAPTLGALPDVSLVWGMDYRPTADRRPLMAYSTIASALGVEDEPVPSLPPSPVSPVSETTDTRPMRSRSLISGIVSDWNSLSQSEQQAWSTLSQARASRSRGSHNSRTHTYDS